MPKDITIPLRDLDDQTLRAMLEAVGEKCERLRPINHGHGNTPEFWKAAAEEVKIRAEIDWRKARGETF